MEPDFGINYSLFLGSLVNAAPGLAVWVAALILSIVLLKRDGGKPERFLVTGSCLMLAETILSIPKQVIADLMAQSSLSSVCAASVISGINLFSGLISLAGIICLFYAIWKKFNMRTKLVTEN